LSGILEWNANETKPLDAAFHKSPNLLDRANCDLRHQLVADVVVRGREEQCAREVGRIETANRITEATCAGGRDRTRKAEKELVKVVVTEQQAIELAAARQLIQRKVFSWNRMIGDIEEYVPKNTRITSIKVDESANSPEDIVARIQVKAVGTTASEMTEMMLNLEKSGGLFTVGETGQDATTETGETPFTLNLTYRPRRGDAQ